MTNTYIHIKKVLKKKKSKQLLFVDYLAQAAATGTLSMAERSYPLSKVRGRSREDPMPKGRWPRGATLRPRPGLATGRTYTTPEARNCGQEEQPDLQGAVASQAQEGLEELFHIRGQKGRQ